MNIHTEPAHTPAPGDIVTLEITGIAHGGVSIARHEGRVFFVHDTLPGETVLARVSEVKKKFARASAVRVLQPSPYRQAHVWSEAALDRDPADRAGGAEFGHIKLSHQRDLKARVLADALQRQGKISAENMHDIAVEPLLGDDHEGALGWRTRVRLHVDPTTGHVGPYAARSRKVIPVNSLPLAASQLNLIAPFDELMPEARTVDLVAPSADDARMLITHANEKSAVGVGDIVYERVFDNEFQVAAGGFWQVHRGGAERLFSEISGAAHSLGDRLDPAASNLDLYGGVGLLATAFLDAAGERGRITSVESADSAADLAAENLAAFSGARALAARTEHYLRDMQQGSAPVRSNMRRATVIADPPRSGLGVDVCASLIDLAPANIIYVACDPVAFARDTEILQSGGYHLSELRALDMFPHTHHFETIGLFLRD